MVWTRGVHSRRSVKKSSMQRTSRRKISVRRSDTYVSRRVCYTVHFGVLKFCRVPPLPPRNSPSGLELLQQLPRHVEYIREDHRPLTNRLCFPLHRSFSLDFFLSFSQFLSFSLCHSLSHSLLTFARTGRCLGERLNLSLSFALILAVFAVW